MRVDLGAFLPCCLGLLVLGVLIAIPVWLVRKGFDLVVGCLGNLLVILVAGVLLVTVLAIADVDICQVWLVGETLCSIMGPN